MCCLNSISSCGDNPGGRDGFIGVRHQDFQYLYLDGHETTAPIRSGPQVEFELIGPPNHVHRIVNLIPPYSEPVPGETISPPTGLSARIIFGWRIEKHVYHHFKSILLIRSAVSDVCVHCG